MNKKTIEIFGMGCKNCATIERNIRAKAQELQVKINLIKIQDPIEIASRGIINTPAVIINNKLVHQGGVADSVEIKEWLEK
jgi:small redox-active disulfide protein 2